MRDCSPGVVMVLALAVLLLAPFRAGALGLGELEVASGLNQRLQARIALVGVQEGEIETLQVVLADAAVFERAGMQRSLPVLSLRFEVVPQGSGGYVRVSSTQPLREPALEFVLEAVWQGGRAMREYSLLLTRP